MAEHGVGDSLTDTGEELDYEEEYPDLSGPPGEDKDDNVHMDDEKIQQESQATGDEDTTAKDDGNGDDPSNQSETVAGESDNLPSAAAAAENERVGAAAIDSAAATESAIETNGASSKLAAADETATAVENGVVDATADLTADASGETACDSGGKTAGTGTSATDSTGTDRKSPESSNNKQKKPIKKITMEGFEGDREVGIVPAVDNPDEAMSCVLCNLVFDSSKNLNSHREHKDHSYSIKGKTPNSGRYSCLLCWKAFSREDLLKDHTERKDHIARCKDKGMVGFYSPPAKFAVMPETEKTWLREKELDRERREKLKKPADKKEEIKELGPKKVDFNHLFEVDSVGECDTFGIKVRKYDIGRRRSKSREKSSSTRQSSRSRRDRSRSPLRDKSTSSHHRKSSSRSDAAPGSRSDTTPTHNKDSRSSSHNATHEQKDKENFVAPVTDDPNRETHQAQADTTLNTQDNPSIDDNTEIETAMLGQQDGDDLDTSADATETDLHDGVSSQQQLEQVDGEDNMTGGEDMASQNESKDDVDCEMTEEKDENMEVDDSKVATENGIDEESNICEDTSEQSINGKNDDVEFSGEDQNNQKETIEEKVSDVSNIEEVKA